MADDLLGQARRLAGVLSSHGVAHAFIGGLSMNPWTIPVPTYDIDVCAELDPEDVPDLIAELDRAGFVPPATPWIESIGSARFQELTVHWPFRDGLRAADIFLATDAFQRSALSRRRRVELDEGFQADVISRRISSCTSSSPTGTRTAPRSNGCSRSSRRWTGTTSAIGRPASASPRASRRPCATRD